MDVDEILEATCQVLIRCVLMGVAALLFWWGALALMGDLAYSVHSWVTPISRQHFDLIHYAGMLLTKSAVSIFFLFPYVAIRLVLRKRRG